MRCWLFTAFVFMMFLSMGMIVIYNDMKIETMARNTRLMPRVMQRLMVIVSSSLGERLC